jgi:subtilisin family serine protease
MERIRLARRIVGLGLSIAAGLSSFPACRNAANKPLSSDHSIRSSPGAPDEFKTEKYKGAEVAAGEAIVKLESCPSDSSQLIKDLELQVQELTGDRTITVTQVGNDCWFLIKSSQSVSELLEKLSQAVKVKLDVNTQQNTKLIHAEPNFVIRIQPSAEIASMTASCNDDLYGRGLLWALDNRAHPGIDIEALRAWTITKGDSNIAVGILDTGLSYDHPDLLDNVWKTTPPISVKIGTDTVNCQAPIHGFNAIQMNCDPSDNNLSDNRGHGTHVSGIIAAVGDNNIGTKGVNWHVTLVALKVIGAAGGTVVDAVKGIEFALQLNQQSLSNIRVLNASWGYRIGDVDPSDNQLLHDEIDKAGRANVLFVASAGDDNGTDNDKNPHYPSGFGLTNVISVTAIDKNGALAIIFGSLSNFGKQTVHLGAPGKGIYSTYPPETGYCYHSNSGTSMAAPFVSGTAALILSAPNCVGLSASQIKDAIMRGTIPTASLTNTKSGGRLNAYQSIVRCLS